MFFFFTYLYLYPRKHKPLDLQRENNKLHIILYIIYVLISNTECIIYTVYINHFYLFVSYIIKLIEEHVE